MPHGMLSVTPAVQLYPFQAPVTDWLALAAYELYTALPLTLSSGSVLRLALSALSLNWAIVAWATARSGPFFLAILYERSKETSGSPMSGNSTAPTADLNSRSPSSF